MDDFFEPLGDWRLHMIDELRSNEMKVKSISAVEWALRIHEQETGHDLLFKEEWTYAPESLYSPQTKVTLYGVSYFYQAHAILEQPDGSKYIQNLGPLLAKNASQEKKQRWKGAYPIGKVRPL